MWGFYVVLACACRVAPHLDAARMMEETGSGPNKSGPSDIRKDGYIHTYSVVPDVKDVGAYVSRCFKHMLLTWVYSRWTLTSEFEEDKPQKLTTKHGLVTYAVNWRVPGQDFEAPVLKPGSIPYNHYCSKMFVSVSATVPNLDEFEEALSENVYIVLRKEDDYMDETTDLKNQFQVWLSEYFHLTDYPENYRVDTVTPLMQNGLTIYVVAFRDLAMKVSQTMVANKGYGNKPSAANFRRVGVVSESAWLLTDPHLECPPVIEGGRERMGYWHMSVHLAQGKQAWILFSCELKTAVCSNKQRAVVKVVGKGIRHGVTYVNIPIRLTDSPEWECAFWWLPHRWADETTEGATKICTVKTPETTNSPNRCQKSYMWQIGNTDFYGQGNFHNGPMGDQMLFL